MFLLTPILIVYLLIHEKWPIGIKRGIIWDTPNEVYTSPRFQNLLAGHLSGTAVGKACLDTTGLCQFDEGYAPYAPHFIPIRGSADRL